MMKMMKRKTRQGLGYESMNKDTPEDDNDDDNTYYEDTGRENGGSLRYQAWLMEDCLDHKSDIYSLDFYVLVTFLLLVLFSLRSAEA